MAAPVLATIGLQTGKKWWCAAEKAAEMADPNDPATSAIPFARSAQPKLSKELMELMYKELRELAGGFLRKERPGHTLQATALVHEAYLRITKVTGIQWQSRAHFFAFAALPCAFIGQ